jgi:hypothetical protein
LLQFGYIQTSQGFYFVEPSEHWPPEEEADAASSPSVMHAIYSLVPASSDPEAHDGDESHCALPHSPSGTSKKFEIVEFEFFLLGLIVEKANGKLYGVFDWRITKKGISNG